MKITIIRSGGFAGLTETLLDLDAGDKGPAAEKMAMTLKSFGFYSLPPFVHGDVAGADMFRYSITVLDRGSSATVEFISDGSPQTAPLEELVKSLTG